MESARISVFDSARELQRKLSEKHKKEHVVYERAWEIFDYLPMRRNQLEDDYINHLWRSFVALDYYSSESKPFSLMPFHLLFMLALQYKVFRIARENKGAYDIAFTMEGVRSGVVLSPGSVFDLGLLSERKLVSLFKLVGLNQQNIKATKALIDNRNDNLAHAKGSIESDSESKIDQYIKVLENLQPCFNSLNNIVSNGWMNEIDADEDLHEFIEIHLLDSILCLADFRAGNLTVFSFNDGTSLEEWNSCVTNMIITGNVKALTWIKHVEANHPNPDRRSIITKLLTQHAQR